MFAVDEVHIYDYDYIQDVVLQSIGCQQKTFFYYNDRNTLLGKKNSTDTNTFSFRK